MIKSLNKRNTSFFFFLVIFGLVAFWGMFHSPLFDEDEGFFAEAARKMVETGDYVKIQVNGEERYDKPALFFWMEALSIHIFGINEFAVRFPSFLFFVLMLRVVYGYVKRTSNRMAARLSVGIMISMVQFQVLSKAAVTDNVLNYFLAASMLSYYDFTQTQEKKKILWFYVFCGLGFLAKGPVAWVIPILVILSFHVIRKEPKELLKLLNPVGIFICLALPLFWFYPAFKASGEFLILDFFLKHNLGRFSATMESHGGQVWYYIPVLFLAFIPFIHFFSNSLFKEFKIKENMFFVLWFVLTFLLFSVSKTQLPHYISYGYVPLIILMSRNYGESNTPAFKIQVFLFMFLFLILPFGLIQFGLDTENVFILALIREVPFVFNETYFFWQGLLLTIALMIQNTKSIYWTLSVFYVSVSLFINSYGSLQQGFVKKTGLSLRGSKKEVLMTNHYNPSLSFYAQQSFYISSEFIPDKYYFTGIQKFNDEEMEKMEEGSGFILLSVK